MCVIKGILRQIPKCNGKKINGSVQQLNTYRRGFFRLRNFRNKALSHSTKIRTLDVFGSKLQFFITNSSNDYYWRQVYFLPCLIIYMLISFKWLLFYSLLFNMHLTLKFCCWVIECPREIWLNLEGEWIS